ncbi:MAG: N-acetylmuramoyl-L-alanine amidase [Pseudomonadota bacterium]
MFLFVLILFLSVGGQVHAQQQDIPVAFNVQIAGDRATTRFFIDFDKNLSIKTFYMDQPYRIIIDLDEASFNFAENSVLQGRGLISSVQYGRISQGRSRIVLTLAEPAEIIKASMQKRLDEEHFRFLLDMDSTDTITFSALLDTQGRDLGESGGVAVKGDRITPVTKPEGRFTVVLDPGHGGIDGGASGRGGAKEKDIVLAFAKRLAEVIENAGPYDVQFTRQDDTFVSLRERLNFSRRVKADLFISIHADSL